MIESSGRRRREDNHRSRFQKRSCTGTNGGGLSDARAVRIAPLPRLSAVTIEGSSGLDRCRLNDGIAELIGHARVQAKGVANTE
jgi:hypothetical protein